MFDLSNTIAYGGLMVYGPLGQRERLEIPPSGWMDIPAAADARGHWMPAEGEQARKMLTALRSRYGVDAEQIFVVSPFRDVADGIEKLLRDFPGVRGGTVHKAQGREFDVVLFVLGGDPAKPRAKEWAARRPNLVNVAVSRARRRLYVIGDRTVWSRYRHFDTLSSYLTSGLDR
jgi:hypothetical protein